MADETVTSGADTAVDWKGLGYLISAVSVLFLGAVAWPKPGAPWWHAPALVIGMIASIMGMASRYKAHRDQQREVRKARAEADRS